MKEGNRTQQWEHSRDKTRLRSLSTPGHQHSSYPTPNTPPSHLPEICEWNSLAEPVKETCVAWPIRYFKILATFCDLAFTFNCAKDRFSAVPYAYSWENFGQNYVHFELSSAVASHQSVNMFQMSIFFFLLRHDLWRHRWPRGQQN